MSCSGMVCVQDSTEFYSLLKQYASRQSSNSLHIFVAASYVDSLVSLKIFTDLLKEDSIIYSVYPVHEYAELLSYYSNSSLRQPNQPYVAVLINCGGTSSLLSEFELDEQSTFFILDSHRPIHLDNISSQQVFVAWTQEDELRDPDIQEFAEVSEEEPSSSEDEDEYTTPHAGDKRRREAQRSLRRQKLEYVLRGSYFGRPVGCTMFDAAHHQRKDENFHLWLACVSITDQFIHCRISKESYQAACMDLEQKIKSGGNMDKPRTTKLEGGLTTRLPDDFRIEYTEELHLMCLPRWNLFSSMEFSSYSCTKLRTWSEPGRRKLRLFFAEMGIKHQIAQQKYPYMDNSVKSRLKDKLEKIAPKYNMDGIKFRTFQLSNGYKTQISAPNIVHGISAILESSCDQECRGDNFWIAASGLHWKGWKEIERGMDMAIKAQEVIVRVGSSLVMRKSLIRSVGGKGGRLKVNYAILDKDPDLLTLAHPLCLVRLVHFVRDIIESQGEKPAPMMISGIFPGSRKAIVVGVMGKPKIEDQTGNIFGQAFGEAAKQMNIVGKYSVFETSCFELDSEHVEGFVTKVGKILGKLVRRT